MAENNYPVCRLLPMAQTAFVMMFIPLFLSGCSLWRGNGPSAGAEPAENKPIVYIHPLSGDFHGAKVGILPFQVPVNIAQEQTHRIAALFKDVLLNRRAFKVVRQLETPYEDLADAVEIGRQAGVDLVMAGKVNYLLPDAGFGGAGAAAAVRLLSVQSGDTVWYIEQAMGQPLDYPDCGMGQRLKVSFVVPPVHHYAADSSLPHLLSRIAVNMSAILAGDPY